MTREPMPPGRKSVLRKSFPSHRYSSRSTIPDALALLTPILLLVGLALGGGGFDLFGRHVAGILAWLVVAGLLLSGQGRKVKFGKPLLWISGLLIALGLLSAISSLWSGSTAKSLVESERLFAYLGFFLVGYLVCRTPSQRQRFVEGLTIAFGLLVLLGLGERLFPSADETVATSNVRLSYPVGYWNGNGMVFGLAIVLFAWMSRVGSWAALRWGSIALIPAASAALYVTYSRGGVTAGIIAGVILFFLSRDRLWLVAVSAVGLLASIPTLRMIPENESIANNLNGEGAPAEGRAVLLVLVIGMILAPIVFYGLLRLARALPEVSGRVVAFSRDTKVIKGTGAIFVTGLVITTFLFGGHLWGQFSGGELYFPDDPEQHFTQLTGTGRYEFNEVAIDAFEANPVHGVGAGSYRYEWSRDRPIPLVAQNAHSLYLEFLAELGVLGGLLIIALVGIFVWLGILASRIAGSSRKTHASIMLAMMVTMVLAFGIDWLWQLADTAALLLLVGAWLTAFVAYERHPEPAVKARHGWAWPRVAGIGLAWVVVVILAVPAISDRYLEASSDSTAKGEIAKAIDQAQTASDLDPWAPEPHMQMGVIAQTLGLYPEAIDQFSKAIELEPENWQTWYLRMLAHHEAGDEEAALNDLLQAIAHNPRSPELEPEALSRLYESS